ncbi:MAG: HEAT repeat domain-containing protein [Planctomycetes bacterium]|nr:HEAT repeat domain-containing protein [Planctomycetota bacterium]
MVQRLPQPSATGAWLTVLAVLALLAAFAPQTSGQPTPADKPKPPESTPSSKELPAQKDGKVIEKTTEPKQPKDEPRPGTFPPIPASPPLDKPPPPEFVPAEKPLSAQQIDALIENAFGKNSPELKRPKRFWIREIRMAIAAENAVVGPNGWSVRFDNVSFSFPDDGTVFHGTEAIVALQNGSPPLTDWSDLTHRIVAAVEVRSKDSTILLTSAADAVSRPGGALIGGSIGAAQLTPPTIPSPKGQGPAAFEPKGAMQMRFKFNIDAKAPLADLLPAPMKTASKLPPWTNEDLAKVPEVAIGASLSRDLPKQKSLEAMAHAMAKMNHLNGKKRDGFMLALLEQRPDLRGLPFLMGDDCRTNQEQARVFAKAADTANLVKLVTSMNIRDTKEKDKITFQSALGEVILDLQLSHAMNGIEMEMPIVKKEHRHRATVAAAMQVFMPEAGDIRAGLAKHLATVPHIDATKALARLAIFSPEHEVREAAIEGLKLRREKDYTDILISGFRYPLPAVSKRAAEALVKLERKDLLVNLIEVLEAADPRLPVTQNRDGQEVTFVREMVKVNHHRNCLLCHAPGNTDNTPEGVLKVAVPLPSEPLPKPAEGGYQSTPPPTPDIVVRLDMTYLRQDFSLMQPVADAHPWPEMQRFDFFVRTRELTSAEAKSYVEDAEPGQLSPYHRAALYALRELTGRDTEPTAAAWRVLLKLPR